MLNVNLKKDRYQILESYNSNVYRVQDELSTCIYILKSHLTKKDIDIFNVKKGCILYL